MQAGFDSANQDLSWVQSPPYDLDRAGKMQVNGSRRKIESQRQSPCVLCDPRLCELQGPRPMMDLTPPSSLASVCRIETVALANVPTPDWVESTEAATQVPLANGKQQVVS